MTSLSGAMYAGISGMSASSQEMAVISNNLANSSTTGYKSTTISFEDVFYQNVHTASGLGQVGVGTTVSSITTDFSQGSYASASSDTSVAINGDGFFVVENSNTGEIYYTRDGEFILDSDGYMVDSNRYRVQGWNASTDNTGNVITVGSATDIIVEDFQSPPNATTEVTMIVNLDSSEQDNSVSTTDPFFSMFTAYDGTVDPPLSEDACAYQTSVKVYDENGTAYDLTYYFDPVSDSSLSVSADGAQIWEYMVCVSPSADGRTIDSQAVGSTTVGGVLMFGTLTFNSSGEVTGTSAYTLKSTAAGTLSDLDQWTAADFNAEGYPITTANFSGSANANATDEVDVKTISINFGLKDETTAPTWAGVATDASLALDDPTNLLNITNIEKSATACTSYDQGSSTLTTNQDGYTAGYYQGLTIDEDGVIWGNYTNGQTLALFTLTMADFNNPNGLKLMGGNLYKATTESGAAITGLANTGTLGAVEANSLEESNVDMSTEMVSLIVSQRMYQANSKVITTADSLLEVAINLVR